MRVPARLLLAAAILTGTGLSASAPEAQPSPRRAVSIIWDDDCGSDLDCIYSLDAIHRQVRRGRAVLLALILDSPNPYGAPVMRAWGELWRQSPVLIGVYRGSTGLAGAASHWSQAVRDRLRPADASAGYPDCVAVYRRALAQAADKSVRVVETGFPTCLAALMRSRGDQADARSGVQLVQAKVAALYVMGGDYPGPASEYNFKTAAAESSYLFRHWTARAGYPPVYLNGFTPGARITIGASAGTPARAAIDVAQQTAGETARPTWDLLSLHQAITGTADYAVSRAGRNSVSADTGRNRWRAGKGNAFYVVARHSAAEYRRLLRDFTGP